MPVEPRDTGSEGAYPRSNPLAIPRSSSTYSQSEAPHVKAAGIEEVIWATCILGLALLWVVIFQLLFVGKFSFCRSESNTEFWQYALALAIVGVPVGLLAVVTTTSAIGASYLAKKKAIVRKLSAIESLAGVEILCSDKTGTLTENKLTLGKPYALRIFDRMSAYIVCRIALSLHLLFFLPVWITELDKALNPSLVVFIAIFADIATLVIAFEKAPYSSTPVECVEWKLQKLWGTSAILGMILQAGSIHCLITMLLNSNNGGIIENHGASDAVLFLEIVLSQNWLIFVTQAVSHWKSLPSWQLTIAILTVDAVATVMAYFGWFLGGMRTDVITLVRVWGLSFAVFCVLGAVYYVLNEWTSCYRFLCGKSDVGSRKEEV